MEVKAVVKKLNESFCYIDTEDHFLKKSIIKILTVEDEASKFKSKFRKYGMGVDKFEFFRLVGEAPNQKIVIPTGLLPFLEKLGIQQLKSEQEFSDEELNEFIENIENSLPFNLYEHQKNAVKNSLKFKQHSCISATGSGKSAIVSLICEFLRLKGLKGLVLVPSIDLVTQIHNDFLDYNLKDLYNSCHLIGGENQEKHLNNILTIGTWQSIMRMKEELPKLDYIIIDECHGLKVDTKSLDIVLNSINARYRIGLTGTLPEQPQDKMAIFSVVGKPHVYIRTNGLVALGLATPVNINVIKLKYSTQDKHRFAECSGYPEQLSFIKEHNNRNMLIAKLADNASQKTGNTVIMTSHIQHGKDIFIEIMKLRAPELVIENKNIIGKKSFEFQQQFRVYFINGETDAKTRTDIKKILESDESAILVSNYQLFSTGINIKKLSNIILASPLKSYTTITQSIGRAIRLHVSKDTANIYDFVDMFSDRGVFAKQYQKRKTLSYEPEGFPLVEREINI